MSKRKSVEKYIIDNIYELTGSDFNKQLYLDMFKSMSDKEFDKFMHKLKDGDILNIIVPHDKGVTNMSLEKNFKFIKKLGGSFFHNLIFTREGGTKIETKYSFYTMLMPFRRTKQTTEKGISVAENDKRIDASTGQVIGDSQSSKLSYPELQILNGMGLKDSVLELMSDRGGNERGRVLKQSLLRYGSASDTIIQNYPSDLPSSKTLKSYFAGMHLKINP